MTRYTVLGLQMTELETYIESLKRHKLLSAKEELELGERIQEGCVRSFEKMVVSNLRLVVALAQKESKKTSAPIEDLIQEGNIGLMVATRKFDPKKGFRFSTYATWWIRQGMKRCNDSLIAIPEYKKDQIRICSQIDGMLKGGFELEECLKMASLSKKHYDQINTIPSEPLSMETPLTEDFSLGDTLSDESTIDPLDNLLTREQAQLLREALASLEDKTCQEIIEARFGLNDDLPRTLSSLAEQFDLSREAIRKIIFREIRKIRHSLVS